MEMAVAERGLLVIDGIATGKAGHAAREEGDNAINIALQDIFNIHETHFDRVSTLIGKTTAKVTVIETENKAHNVVPAHCRFIVDVRVNELYNFEEVMGILRSKVRSELISRSFRLKSSIIPLEHPLVKAGHAMGLPHYGSPTTSDKALMPFPALKIGPGDSARSHTANEYIYLRELEDGINKYIQLLNITLSSLKS
jgi:acetylornithine deacetylase